jgi:hypothetical protein
MACFLAQQAFDRKNPGAHHSILAVERGSVNPLALLLAQQ